MKPLHLLYLVAGAFALVLGFGYISRSNAFHAAAAVVPDKPKPGTEFYPDTDSSLV